MSTAGKVLVVLVTLTTLVWMILASGVAQLNRNGNTALHNLEEQLAKAQGDLKQTQNDIVAFHDEASTIQEKVDRDDHRAPLAADVWRTPGPKSLRVWLAVEVPARHGRRDHQERARRPLFNTATRSTRPKRKRWRV